MVGQSMAGGRYAYYRCRRSYAGNFEETCDSKYVPVAPLERNVINQIIEILADPNRILAEAKHFSERGTNESKIIAVEGELQTIEEQQRKLADLYVAGSLPQDILDAKSEELNQRRLRFEAESKALLALHPRRVDLDRLSTTLPAAATRIKQWVLGASEDDMESILGALRIQVTASKDELYMEGSIPAIVPDESNLVTIARTSGCLSAGAYNHRAVYVINPVAVKILLEVPHPHAFPMGCR